MKWMKHSVAGILFFLHINSKGLQAQEILNLPATLSDTLIGHSDEDDVIVSALFRPQTLTKSVYQVRVLDAKRISSQGAVRVQDVLRTELNIRFRQDLALGGSNMNIGGMTGENVKILLNGVPIVGRQGTANEVDINQIDINTIERIEIVEGPMSTIYGSDAIAGIINIITKQSARKGITGRISAHEETVGKDYGLQQGLRMQSAQLGWASQKWSVQGGVGHYHFMGWQGDTAGRVMTWKPKQQYTGFGNVRYKAKLWDASYRIDVMDETIVNAGNFIFNTANDQRFVTGRLAQQLQINVRPYKDWLVQGMVAHTLFTRETINTEVDRATGLQYFSSVPGDVTQFTGTAFRLNASKKLKDNFDMQAGVDGNFDNGSGGRLKPGSNLITDLGFFVVPEWTVGKRLVLKPGLRMLYNSVYDAPPVVPSVNAKIALSEKAEARLAYARGFRAPSLRELYFFFFDANHQIQGNPNLRPETSDSYQAAVKWNLSSKDDKTRMHVQASAFYNHVMDKIGMAQDAVNPQLTTYMNIDLFKTAGFNLQYDATWNNWKATAGAGYVGRYNMLLGLDKTLPQFMWSPELVTNISYAWQKPALTFNIHYKYTGRLPFYQRQVVNGAEQIRLAEISAFHWMDGTVQKQFWKNKITVQGGVRNLFNITNVANTGVAQGAHGTAGPQAIGYGRSFFLNTSFQF